MTNSFKNVAVIPARKNSKSIKNKNIALFRGKPLIDWSIEVAIETGLYSKIYVSTDSENIIDYVSKYKSISPILRPSSISDDLSRDVEFLSHLVEIESLQSEFISILRPTSPLRRVEVLSDCIQCFNDKSHIYSSLRWLSPLKKTPLRLGKLTHEVPKLVPITQDINIIEPYNAPRQILPKTYWQTGYGYCVATTYTNRVYAWRYYLPICIK